MSQSLPVQPDGIVLDMSDVTQILRRLEQGEAAAAEELLPRVYEELRQLAGHRMSKESPGQTIQATALVHEAWLRLVDSDNQLQKWDSRAHFCSCGSHEADPGGSRPQQTAT